MKPEPTRSEEITWLTPQGSAELSEGPKGSVLTGAFQPVKSRPADAEPSRHVILRKPSFPTKVS